MCPEQGFVEDGFEARVVGKDGNAVSLLATEMANEEASLATNSMADQPERAGEHGLVNEPSQLGSPRDVLKLAWPLMLSTGLFSLTLFVDRTLLYWYSNDAASAAMSAGTAFWVVICVPTGMIGYTSTFVSQYYGANRLDRAMQVVVQGLALSVLIGPFFLIVALFIGDLFRWFQHPPELIAVEVEYFRWIAPGAWAMVFSSAMTGLFAGIGKTRVLLLCDFVSTAINVVLDCLLIFGWLGFPRMGVAGAALASSVAIIAKVVLLAWIVYRYWQDALANSPELRATFRPQWDGPLMARLLRFGWPAGIQMLAESVSFSIIMLFVGRLGSISMAATTLALGVNLIAFVPINGLGMAVSVLVGQHLTAGRLDIAKRCVRSGLWIAGIYGTFFAVLYGLFPDFSMLIYSVGTEAERFDEMKPILRPLLWFIAGYCIFDALQIVYMSAIKGAGDTRFVLIASILIGLTVVGMGKLLGDLVHGELYWWWGVIMAWVLAMAVVFSSRYYQGKWQKMRVIESEIGQ